MRGWASVVVAMGLGGAVWAGLSYRTSLAQDEAEVMMTSGPPVADHVLDDFEPESEPDEAAQRAALNARLQTMIGEGKGARLMDGSAQAQVAVRRARKSSAARTTPASSVQSRTVRYQAPKLDLTTPPNMPSNELDCLTQAIYYEARNESEAGQAAVAEVVMNRVRSPSYPNGVCAVVYQRNSRTCQFTFTCDGSIGRGAIRPAAWSRAQHIAREVYEGRSSRHLPSNSVNYHANYVRPSWGQRLDRVRQIGAHIFYGSDKVGRATPGAETPEPEGLIFVRNEAIENAYARIMAQEKPAGAS